MVLKVLITDYLPSIFLFETEKSLYGFYAC